MAVVDGPAGRVGLFRAASVTAKLLTEDEAGRIAANIAKLPEAFPAPLSEDFER
jgi:hypothetical protein